MTSHKGNAHWPMPMHLIFIGPDSFPLDIKHLFWIQFCLIKMIQEGIARTPLTTIWNQVVETVMIAGINGAGGSRQVGCCRSCLHLTYGQCLPDILPYYIHVVSIFSGDVIKYALLRRCHTRQPAQRRSYSIALFHLMWAHQWWVGFYNCHMSHYRTHTGSQRHICVI